MKTVDCLRNADGVLINDDDGVRLLCNLLYCTPSLFSFLPLLVANKQLPRFFPSILASYRSRYAGSGTFRHAHAMPQG
jgi:hypothetical protein